MAHRVLRVCIILWLVCRAWCVPKANDSLLIKEDEGETYPGQWPWLAAIYQTRERVQLVYKCAGTLITSKFVLTAGICRLDVDRVRNKFDEDHYVRLGVHNLNAPNLAMGQHRRVAEIHLPSHYPSMRALIVALFELRADVQFNDFVQPASVFSSDSSVGLKFGMMVGWGRTYDEPVALPKKNNLEIKSYSDCYQRSYNYNANNSRVFLFCAESKNKVKICQKDSGNGYFVKFDGNWRVAGVVSNMPKLESADQCFTDGNIGITKLFDFLPWIGNITGQTFVAEKLHIKEGKKPDPSQRYRSLLPRQCGSFVSDRIINGQDAPLFAYPWMVQLIGENPENLDYVCAGTLISVRYVLTNSRSFHHIKLVRLGEHTMRQHVDCNANDETDCAPPYRDYAIERVTVYPDEDNPWPNDRIALVRLKRDVTFEDHIQPICLPITPELRQQKPAQYIITGWGSTNLFYRRSLTLQQATISADSVTEFDRNYVNYRNEPDPRTGLLWEPSEKKVATCVGDEGGPLGYPVRHRGTIRFMQFGVIVNGLPGCTGGPSVYLNVSRYMDWILANMEE